MNKVRRSRVRAVVSTLTPLIDEIEDIRSEEEDVLENTPENLQGSYRYEETEEYVDALNEAASNLQYVVELLEDI